MKTPQLRHYTAEHLLELLDLYKEPRTIYEAQAVSGMSWRLFDEVSRYFIKEGFLMMGKIIQSPINRDIVAWKINPDTTVKPREFAPMPFNKQFGRDETAFYEDHSMALLGLMPAQSIELMARMGIGTKYFHDLISYLMKRNLVIKRTEGTDRRVFYYVDAIQLNKLKASKVVVVENKSVFSKENWKERNTFPADHRGVRTVWRDLA